MTSEFYCNGEEFLATYKANRPGCLVTEMRLLGINGIELQELLLAEHPLLPVVFVTAIAETSFTVRAMRNGAVTVLDKPFSHQHLWDVIRYALARAACSRRVASERSELRHRLSRLNDNERHVLDLMTQGKANKVIARELKVSVRTVESRRHKIFQKTKTGSLAELLRLILQVQSEADYRSNTPANLAFPTDSKEQETCCRSSHFSARVLAVGEREPSENHMNQG